MCFTKVLFPLPDTPVTTVSISKGKVTSIFFRLLARAPLISIKCLEARTFLGISIVRLPLRYSPVRVGALRSLPAIKALAKEMLPIVDKPTIQFIVEEALKSGIEDILVVTGKSKRSIEDHFDSNFELEYNLKEKGKDDLLKLVDEKLKKANI